MRWRHVGGHCSWAVAGDERSAVSKREMRWWFAVYILSVRATRLAVYSVGLVSCGMTAGVVSYTDKLHCAKQAALREDG